MNDQSKSSTIMYTVIDGYSTILSEDKQKARSLLDKSRTIIKPLVDQYNGEWHKDTLSSFSNSTDAVNCALQIQKRLKTEPSINLKIGIHVGDTLFGTADGVKIATGIGEIAEPRSVYISEQVYYAIRSKLDIDTEFLGEKILGNVNRPIKVYALKIGEKSDIITETRKEKKKPSIAVLPFVDMSPEKDQDWFCDGTAEEIINKLTQIEDIKVIARTSSSFFKGKDVNITDIGEKLDVKWVLEGSVRKSGNKIRVTAQLINVVDQTHIFSNNYDRELEDIFTIQDEISLGIVEALKVKLLKKGKTAVVKRHTENKEAYELYLKGIYYWNKRTEDGYRKGINSFKKAIDKDPQYAKAYAGLSQCYSTLGIYHFMDSQTAYSLAMNAVQKALEIDNLIAETHFVLGLINLHYDWHFPDAERECRRTLELNGNFAPGHYIYASVLAAMGRHEESIKEVKIAHKLDPLSLYINAGIGGMYAYAHRYNEAIEQLHKTLEMDKNFQFAIFCLGMSYIGKMQYDKAVDTFQKYSILTENDMLSTGLLGYSHALAGNKEKADQLLNKLNDISMSKYVSPFLYAAICRGLNKQEEAYKYLEKAFESKDQLIAHYKVTPLLNIFRSDTRFKALLKKMNLDD